MLGDPPVWGSQEVHLLQPALGLNLLFMGGYHASTYLGIHQSRGPRRLTCLYLPGDLISRRLSCLNLPGDLHPDQGIPGSQVATVLGRISFRKTSLRKSTNGNRRRPISCGTVPSLSNNSGAQQEPYYLSEKAKRGPSKVYQSAPRLLWGTDFFLSLKKIIYFNWRLTTLQYCSDFCHTLTWISHGCTSVPHPEPPSHLPPHPIPQGHPSALALSTVSHA